MTNRASSRRPAITNQVRHDQRSREEDLAKNEVAEKAVPFAAGDTAGQKAMAVQRPRTGSSKATNPCRHLDLHVSGVPLVRWYPITRSCPPCERQDRRRSAAELAASAQQTPPRS